MLKHDLPSTPGSPFTDNPFGPLDPGIPINYNKIHNYFFSMFNAMNYFQNNYLGVLVHRVVLQFLVDQSEIT